ncbi:MFS transporter [Georhizobium profundi]|uniref:MFS transporter n=1 Tax=Georhizobium profundi TaxID=2341112 RepID=A0A3S9B946_9HYPH|nr:MFS transporter [Georhizobium profundi]AZN73374.1 MFS transporter [Georhizobium profundi]
MPFLQFIAENMRWLGGAFLLTFFSSFGQTFFISLSSSGIRSEYDLSHGEFGGIYMLATFASALTLPLIGKTVDRYSAAAVASVNIPLLACASIAMAYSNSIVALIIVIYALRLLGQGMMTHNALTAIGRWYAAQRGRAMSLTVIGHQAGEAVLPILFVAATAWVGWRSTWLMAAALLLLVGLPVIVSLMRIERQPRSSDGVVKRGAERHWTRGEVLRDPIFWLTCLGVLAPGFIGTTIFFHQVYLVELRGWSLTVFAGYFVAMSAMTVTFSLISGQLIDRFTAIRLLPIFLIPLGASCFVLASWDAQMSGLIFMLLLGVSYGFSSTLMGAVWPEMYGTRHLGAVRSVVIAILVFATSAGPGLTGYLIDIGVAYPTQIAVMGGYCFVASALLFVVSRHIIARNRAQAVTWDDLPVR